MPKKTVVLLALIIATAAVAMMPVSGASGDTVCPRGQQTKSYCVKVCVVPKVVGKTPEQARKLLGKHDCRLGKVRRKERDNDLKGNKRSDRKERMGGERHLRIVRQSKKPGSQHRAGAKVNVTAKH